MRAGQGGLAAARPLSMLERQMGRENLNNASSGPSPYVYGSAAIGRGASAGESYPPPGDHAGFGAEKGFRYFI